MSEVQPRDELVGAWQLISWENHAADGRVTYPMGTDAVGYLTYTADGRCSVMISRAGRAVFSGNDLLSATVEEKARAVEGFVAYAGRYTFHGDRVVHHVELSLFPTGSGATRSGSSSYPRTSSPSAPTPSCWRVGSRSPAWSGSESTRAEALTELRSQREAARARVAEHAFTRSDGDHDPTGVSLDSG